MRHDDNVLILFQNLNKPVKHHFNFKICLNLSATGFFTLEGASVFGRPAICPKKQLLAVMWLLATPDSYRSVGDRFGIGKSNLFFCFVRVLVALNRLAPSLITWPRGEHAERIQQEFFNMAGLRGVIGAVDGTYIPIKAPKDNPEVYINRKCFHGIPLQAICDIKRKFTHCFTGYPSSVSDARIFRNSDIFNDVLQNPDMYFAENNFIIGDKAYPILHWCIPPYIDFGNLLDYERNFNTVHAKTRQIIERAFALLFGRLRRLRYINMNRTDLIPATIIACCVIHNICLLKGDDLLPQFEAEGMQFVHGGPEQPDIQHDHHLIVQQSKNRGIDMRRQIAQNIYV